MSRETWLIYQALTRMLERWDWLAAERERKAEERRRKRERGPDTPEYVG